MPDRTPGGTLLTKVHREEPEEGLSEHGRQEAQGKSEGAREPVML